MELILSHLLRIGVLLAGGLVLLGGGRYLLKYGAAQPHYGTLVQEPDDLRHVVGIARAAVALRGRGLIQMGLLLLIATPVARVAFSLVAFARQGDRTYLFLTAVVLLVLLASLASVGR